ncbi:MAG: hypothetical protein KGZ86_01180 [Candidatus Latescibacteria bacterium]|nr:hypothetical protein [Candidatus Latescibacterota bacterium]
MNRLLLISGLFLLVSVCFADTTFFSEDFNAEWSTADPPNGWTITYQDSAGPEDWHRDSSNIWSANHSGYAKISYTGKLNNTDPITDSLISPIIDCWRYRNVVLRCSSYFRHASGSYTAKIIGSKDGGVTYPYIIADFQGYYDDSVMPAKTINLNWAAEQESVRIAYVFIGPIINIQFWCLDDISITGQYIFDNDVATIEIIKPSNIQPLELCTLKTKIINLGKQDLDSIFVGCSIYQAGSPIAYAWTTVASLSSQESLIVSLLPPYEFETPGFNYHIKAWSYTDSDDNPANDTIEKYFIVSQSELLSYHDNFEDDGACFPIREQGWGVRYTPSNYPALINQVQCYLGFSGITKPYRYKIRIVDDDGFDGTPGTTIYESGNMTDSVLGMKSIYLFNEELYIDTGSVYLFYIQVEDAPNAPMLFHDEQVNPLVQYYKYHNGTYQADNPSGDWMMQMLVVFHERYVYQYDLRVVYISEPIDEFVRRPVNFQTPIKARIENFGDSLQSNFSVSCTIRSFLHGIPGAVVTDFAHLNLALTAGRDTFVEFFPWNLIYNEPVEITVRTHLAIDQQPDNNFKKKIVTNKIAKFTGSEGPGIGYAWYDSDTTDGPVFNWFSTERARLLLSSGNDTIVPWPMLFNFPYYDSIYNTVYVSTNGFITFSPNQPSSPENWAIPSPGNPNNALYVFWDDLQVLSDNNSAIYYQDYGALPNRFCVITWQNLLRKDTDPLHRLNFQIVLHENGDILYQYKDVYCNRQSADYGKSATIGIENLDGSSGLQYLLGTDSVIENWPENKLSANRAIKLYRQIRDAGVISIVQPSDSIVPLPTRPFVSVKNFGTERLDTLPVYLSISTDTLPAHVVYDTFLLLFDLLPNEQRTIPFPDWNASVGKYVMTCSTNLSGDQNQSNNLIRKSILVTVWILKPEVPKEVGNRRVKNGALVYASAYHKIFALKGSTNEFWSYDIASNQWESLPRMPLPLSNRPPKAGCALTYGQGRKIYAIKGGNRDDFYVYDIPDATWTQLAPVRDTILNIKKPKDGASIVYSEYDGLIYAIVGNKSTQILRYVPGSPPQGDYWQYVDKLSDDKNFRHGASIKNVDSILYIFQGNKTKNLHRYNLARLSWLSVCTLPSGKKRNVVKAGGTSTYHNPTNSLYFFLGGNRQDLWQYNVLNNTFDSVSVIPRGPNRKKIKSGAAITAAGPNDPIFVLKGGNTNEFWAYAFWSPGAKLDRQPNHISDNTPQQIQTDEQVLLPNTINISSSNMIIKISYNLIQPSHVHLNLYSITGQLIKTFVNCEQTAGSYTINWPSRNVTAKGIFFIKGNIGSIPVAKKIIIL